MSEIRTPSSNTLLQMFGDDTPIGQSKGETYQQEMSSANDIESAIKAVVNYAQGLHKEQENYDRVSPFGGEDITVQHPVEIAFDEIPSLKELPFLKNTSEIEIERLLVDALEPKVEMWKIRSFVEDYEKEFSYANTDSLYRDFRNYERDYDKAISEIDHKAMTRASEIKSKGLELYQDSEEKIKDLKKRHIYKVFHKEEFSKEMAELVHARDEGQKLMDTTLDEVKEMFADEYSHVNVSIVPPVIGFDEYNQPVFVDSREMVLSFMASSRQYITNDEHRKRYEQFCRYLGREPKTGALSLSEQEVLCSDRTSIRNRIMAAKVQSSEVEFERNDVLQR